MSGGGEPRRPDRLAVLLIGLVLLPPLLLLARQLVAGLPEIAVGSDPALVELATVDAAHGRQSLGPYSRFGFHHPGPAMFYFLLPGYLLGGRTHGGLLLGALLLNLFGLAATAVAATRLGERWLALATLALLPLLVLRLGPAGLSSAWNPNLVVIAFVATVISGAAVALGASAPLPLLVVAGSLAAQSHLALVGPVATVVVFAAALRVLARPPRTGAGGSAARGARPAFLIAAVIAVAAWAPVVVEQIASEHGNLTRIAAYVAKARPAQSLAATLDAYGSAAGSWLAAPFGFGDGSRSAGAIGLALAALQPVALALAVRRRRPALEVLAGLGTALAVIALVTIRGMASPLHDYLTRWVAGLGLVHGAVVLGALQPRRLDQDAETQPACRAALAAVVGVAVLGTGLGLAKVAAYPSWRKQAAAPVFARIGRAGAAASAWKVGTGPVHVSIGAGASWELAAGVVLRLVKDGRAVSVDPQWAFMFGPGRAGPPEAIRLLVCEAGPACVAGETVWQEDDTRVALLPGPG